MQSDYSSLRERRVAERKQINLPISILAARSTKNETEFQSEKTRTLDISSTGVRIELSFSVVAGDRLSINSTGSVLNAKMAVFVVRWSRRVAGRYIIGAERIYGQGRWRVSK